MIAALPAGIELWRKPAVLLNTRILALPLLFCVQPTKNKDRAAASRRLNDLFIDAIVD
jgi:hypothetical protein